MDQPLAAKGPVARWQRKALETSSNSFSGGANSSLTNPRLNISGGRRLAGNLSTSCAGSKRLSESVRKTPSKAAKNAWTPSKSPSRLDMTPGGTRRTPSRTDGDRFIPSRSGTDFDTSRFLLLRGDLIDGADDLTAATMSPSKRQFQRQMAENLYGAEVDKSKIISYRNKAPTPSEVRSSYCNLRICKLIFANCFITGSFKWSKSPLQPY
jgi:hypothetical protein